VGSRNGHGTCIEIRLPARPLATEAA